MSVDAAPDRIGITLDPLDTLFFRDGRPFDGTPRAMSGLPMPQTLTGALRTWLLREHGCDFGALGRAIKDGLTFSEACGRQSGGLEAVATLRFRGPWFAHNDSPVVPAPATLQRCKDSGQLIRLDPLQDDLPGWQPLENGMRPLWIRDRRATEATEGFLTLHGLKRFLANDTPAKGDLISPGKLYGFDRRTGIVVGPQSRTAEPGEIYGVSLLVLKPGVTFYAEIVGAEEALDCVPTTEAVISFGGEGRRVLARRRNPVAWPAVAPEHRVAGRTMILLITPGLFSGWKPGGLQPIAAAVPGHVAVSGWDLARGGPKPNRFAVAAGSVYFLDQEGAKGPLDGSLCAEEDAAAGWGDCVEGTWNYA